MKHTDVNDYDTSRLRRGRTCEMKCTRGFFWICVLVALAVLPGCERPRAQHQLERIMSSFLDPIYYVVAHDDLPIGTYTRGAIVTKNKAYEFRTTLTMPSANGLILTTEAVYQFQSKNPYLLSTATRTTHAGSKDTPYSFEHLYPEVKNNMENREDIAIEKRDEYGLSQFFALELALMADGGHTLSEIETSVTPYRSIASSTTWVVRSRTNQEITLSSSAEDLATYSLERGIPNLVSLVDNTGLSMTLTPEESFDTLELQLPHVVEEIMVPVDRPIENPRAATALSVEFVFADGELGPWVTLLDANSTLTSSMQPKTSSTVLLNWAVSARDAYTNDELRTIVSSVVKNRDKPHQIVNALVSYVNRTITYKERNTLQSVEETLAKKVGDCTELSQLFTALASAAELTARTVVGLAYQESSQTFGIHAWNEVQFNDGSVRVVDPTWNQIYADATHIEFPPAYQHEIVATLKDLHINVLNVSYDSVP